MFDIFKETYSSVVSAASPILTKIKKCSDLKKPT